MKCTVCPSQAVIKLKRHNAAFCKDHYKSHVVSQVEKAIHDHAMFTREDRIMVCVSGGKDSLVLWYILHQLGYDTTGMYISLGIDGYSDRSLEKVNRFAEKHGLKSIVVNLKEKNQAIPVVSYKSRRPYCSVCGVIKRYYFNRVAWESHFTIVATGHNLDDEGSRLLGNLLQWQREHLEKQDAVLAATGRVFKRKVKPLVRLTEKEIAAYAFINGIDYLVEECPYSKRATSMVYKDAMNLIDDRIPNTKHFFYFQFLENKDLFARAGVQEASEPPCTCTACGFPSFNEVCSFCRLVKNGS